MLLNSGRERKKRGGEDRSVEKFSKTTVGDLQHLGEKDAKRKPQRDPNNKEGKKKKKKTGKTPLSPNRTSEGRAAKLVEFSRGA